MTMTNMHAEDAIAILNKMKLLVEGERMVRGDYLSHFPGLESVPEVPLCNGFRACAVGTLWLASGAKPDGGRLPMVDESVRWDYVSDKPALALALETLNTRADQYIEDHEMRRSCFEDSIEALFESPSWDENSDEVDEDGDVVPYVPHNEMIDVINSAIDDLELMVRV